MEEKVFSEIKIFQIDKSQYELRGKSNSAVVDYIVDAHRIKVEKYSDRGKVLPNLNKNGAVYQTYTYNESIKDSYWRRFLPKQIAKGVFDIQQLSFVLFASVGNNVYAVVGGTGIRVIKRFINDRFGIEMYEFMAIKSEDIVISLTVRGITGNLTEQKEIYRKEQTLLDVLDLTEIPTKIVLILGTHLKDTLFPYLVFKKDLNYLEIGSYFFLKTKIDFENLHEIIITLENIQQTSVPVSLTSFVKIKDVSLIESTFEDILFENIRKEVNDRFSASRSTNPYKVDIDFVHPTRLQEFYECDRFEMKSRGSKKPFSVLSDRNKIYDECLEYIYNSVDDITDLIKFKNFARGIRIIGYRNGIQKTQAMFFNHLTTEIDYQSRPIFKIDNGWYRVEDTFINQINNLCLENIEKNLISNVLTKKWDSTIADENMYNKLYLNEPGYLVFDKSLGENIELCDVMFEDKDKIYLVHVKDGFDAKMRDLANQVTISADRLWHDLNNFKKSNFINQVTEKYNKTASLPLDTDYLINKFKSKKEIVFVMAFRTKRKHLSLEQRILQSRSNIAKYSVLQCVKDIKKYDLKIIDITGIL